MAGQRILIPLIVVRIHALEPVLTRIASILPPIRGAAPGLVGYFDEVAAKQCTRGYDVLDRAAQTGEIATKTTRERVFTVRGRVGRGRYRVRFARFGIVIGLSLQSAHHHRPCPSSMWCSRAR